MVQMTEDDQRRLNMVDSQVRTSDVTDRRIQRAMLEVPREMFAPESLRSMAYMDSPLPVLARSDGQRMRTLLSPRSFAMLVQLAGIEADSRVLDVGCATGYSTAILARLAQSVVAVESDRALANAAKKNLRALGATNVAVVENDLTAGAPEAGPYHAIVLNGAVEQAPLALLEQLADGGRLVAIVADGALRRARIWQRAGKTIADRPAFEADAEVLPGFEREPEFVF
jgi:protein-L-isoaspartate(D-aspartate) O-methyltransferase